MEHHILSIPFAVTVEGIDRLLPARRFRFVVETHNIGGRLAARFNGRRFIDRRIQFELCDSEVLVGFRQRDFLLLHSLCRDLHDRLISTHKGLLLIDHCFSDCQFLFRFLLQSLLLVLQFLLLCDLSGSHRQSNLFRRTNARDQGLNNLDSQRLAGFAHGNFKGLLKFFSSLPLNKFTA